MNNVWKTDVITFDHIWMWLNLLEYTFFFGTPGISYRSYLIIYHISLAFPGVFCIPLICTEQRYFTWTFWRFSSLLPKNQANSVWLCVLLRFVFNSLISLCFLEILKTRIELLPFNLLHIWLPFLISKWPPYIEVEKSTYSNQVGYKWPEKNTKSLKYHNSLFCFLFFGHSAIHSISSQMGHT